MSKPRYRWWGYVLNVIRAYPGLKMQLSDLREQTITASTSGGAGGKGTNRTTEAAALRELPKEEQREYEAVYKTILITGQMRTGQDRLKLMELYHWKRSHTLAGAAATLHISYDTAVNYNRDFIMLVAYHMDRVPYEKLSRSQKITLESQKGVLE